MTARTIKPAALVRLRDAALSRTPVSLGLRRTASPHEFYRYPARFSPELATAAIQAFSKPGDLVADYFLGGGTTLVEARLASRIAVGSDINSMAVFVSRVKTRLYTRHELDDVAAWAERAVWPTSKHEDELPVVSIRNFDDPALAEQRRVVVTALRALDGVNASRAQDFARCVLLRSAQWGLDMRGEMPSADDLRGALSANAASMINAARLATTRYRSADMAARTHGLPRCLVLQQGLPGVAQHRALARHPKPRLVLTSPPYPGVYVNYHRWKLRGRLETPLPYFIAGQNDGNGLAYYTMAARSDRTLATYFRRLEAAFADIARLCGANTWLVQVVGFSDVDDQLRRYLATMTRAGFTEVRFDDLAADDDGRLWRDVPGRRWWARAGERSEVVQHTSREVLLVHKLSH